jgi:hypothetical protein
MTPLHLGALHPFEQALTLLLAFGPFVALAVVIWLRRREDSGDVTAGDRATIEEGPTAPTGGDGPDEGPDAPDQAPPRPNQARPTSHSLS